ncbi:MAG: hypothetical protein BWY86_00319 [Candidatus Aminicenantes bacterium ADurb.Bin508]|nr:MAG: hypothetical protein BWY86_00319 [Candidatus Aminicenantes bacterium ADurb.Bin508]
MDGSEDRSPELLSLLRSPLRRVREPRFFAIFERRELDSGHHREIGLPGVLVQDERMEGHGDGAGEGNLVPESGEEERDKIPEALPPAPCEFLRLVLGSLLEIPAFLEVGPSDNERVSVGLQEPFSLLLRPGVQLLLEIRWNPVVLRSSFSERHGLSGKGPEDFTEEDGVHAHTGGARGLSGGREDLVRDGGEWRLLRFRRDLEFHERTLPGDRVIRGLLEVITEVRESFDDEAEDEGLEPVRISLLEGLPERLRGVLEKLEPLFTGESRPLLLEFFVCHRNTRNTSISYLVSFSSIVSFRRVRVHPA